MLAMNQTLLNFKESQMLDQLLLLEMPQVLLKITELMVLEEMLKKFILARPQVSLW